MKSITIEDVLDKIKIKNKAVDQKLIIEAYEYAKEKHKNQLRKSGEPYIIHPLNVAYTLAKLGLDKETICSALLHDVVEDTNGTIEEIEKKFGKEIKNLVEGVTKLNNLFETVEEKQTENYKKMFIAMEKDIRVIILKLADRLHNITTLEHLRRDRQIAISQETIDLYAPIAHKLGMYDLKMQLQDGAFRYLYPEEYEKITKELEAKINKNEEVLEKTKNKISNMLTSKKVYAILKIEPKHVYNIYKKMTEKKIDINQIKDLFAIKIIANNKSDCYKILGIIHNMYYALPKTFKDYIATPRNNRYQAIHEIMLGEKGIVFEVQICSNEMDKIAKYGIINYFSYIKKEETNKEELKFKKNLSGIYDSLELENLIESPKEFLSTLKTEVLDDEIYIFTPKGDIKVLPKGATPIDFAYNINDEIGNYMAGSKINNIEMPVITKLKNGDIVEIITNREGSKPQEEWLNLIKTAKAKSKVVELLKKKTKENQEQVTVQVTAKDRKNLVLEISDIFTKNKINIESLRARVEEERAKIKIVIKINQRESIEKILQEILNVKDTILVSVL